MKEAKKPDPLDALGAAYERLLERSIDDAHRLEKEFGPSVRRWIEEARDKAVELGEMSVEEGERIAAYLKRDLSDAGRYMARFGDELSGWWGFESDLIETSLFQRFLAAADRTTLELRELSDTAGEYHTGEITGPGTLVCRACGENVHFHKPGRIPPCPKCHATRFVRPDA
ncbi:MAG: zinc ribbon-containing protein [Gammaproteobacteria bacterium]|nr:zinc ribbon-containing protein [Gammaproteobacteria bacterium]